MFFTCSHGVTYNCPYLLELASCYLQYLETILQVNCLSQGYARYMFYFLKDKQMNLT